MEYRFTNTQALIYTDRALIVEPGDVVDWPDGPPEDGHWEPSDAMLHATADEAEQLRDPEPKQSPAPAKAAPKNKE